MFGKVVEVLIVAGMKNHIYRFGNKIRIQKSGGPIGLGLTGEVADCNMIDWDKKYLKKLSSLGISPPLYARFKDDIAIVTEELENGTCFENDELQMNVDNKMLNEGKDPEEVTMEVLNKIANSIDPMVKLTIDIPSKYKNKKLPVLDIQINVNKEENNRIDYEYYEKPMKNKKVLLSDAAIPSKEKRTILTQECMRVLRNTKIELGIETRNKHLNAFMLKMKNSGYPVKYRKEILNSALKGFEKMVKDNENGTKPLFRDRNWNKEERNKEKRNKKTNWYKQDKNKDYKTVLFVPITKGGALLKELKIREEELNKNNKERIKIVEGGGRKVSQFLINKNPFQIEKCKERRCLVCKSETEENPKYLCSTNNAGYRLICKTCKERNRTKIYEGETSRSARSRSKEHLSGLINKNTNNVLYKHKQIDHSNEEMEIIMEITNTFKDPLTRQANEGVRINKREKTELLNSKTEFNHPKIPRITIEKNKINSNLNNVRSSNSPISVQNSTFEQQF